MGGKDHATIINSIENVEDWIYSNKRFINKYINYINYLKSKNALSLEQHYALLEKVGKNSRRKYM